METTTAILEHCIAVYDAMAEQASVETMDEDGNTALVYEGFLTHLIKDDVGLSVPYYTKVTRELKRMECVHQIRRGGSTSPSRWVLLQAPTTELWNTTQERVEVPQTRDQRIADLNRRVGELEEIVQALVEAQSG